MTSYTLIYYARIPLKAGRQLQLNLLGRRTLLLWSLKLLLNLTLLQFTECFAVIALFNSFLNCKQIILSIKNKHKNYLWKSFYSIDFISASRYNLQTNTYLINFFIANNYPSNIKVLITLMSHNNGNFFHTKSIFKTI